MQPAAATGQPNKIGDAIDGFEKGCQTSAAHLKKVRERLARYRKSLAVRTSPNELEKLISNLQPVLKEPPRPNLAALVDQLQKLLSETRSEFAESFVSELRRLCSAEQLVCRPHGDGFGVGPFLLIVDAARENCVVSYAKVNLGELPLVAAECVLQLKQWKAEILDQSVDLSKARTCFEEAMRVAVARKRKPASGEIRAELPQVFREVQFIKQGEAGSSSRTTNRTQHIVRPSRDD